MVQKQMLGRGKRGGGKEQQWREILGEQGQSGESVRAFCRERGLKEAAFYWWRREIERRDREAEEPRSKALLAKASVLAPVVMVEEVCREKTKNSERLAAIEIVLRCGTMVRVSNNATREQLGMVLDVLERSRC